MSYRCVYILILASACLLSGCSKGGDPAASPTKTTNAATTHGAKRVFEVKGVVKEVMPEKKKVRIAHEKVPGYMDAMTMSFDVKGPTDLKSLQPGDPVRFQMVVTDDDGWIENLVKSGTNAAPETAASEAPFRRVKEVEPLQIGDKMPDYHFTNEMGKAVSLSDYKGQAVAFTFIYTRCPFPTYCPRITSNFKSTYQLLQGMSNAPTNWHLLSITIDPQYDTPGKLKDYADHQKADPTRWNFLTGDLIDITAIAEQFGLLFWRPEADKPTAISHNLRTVVIDAEGKVSQVLKENEWKPETLAGYIVEAAKPQAAKAAANNK